MKFSFENDCLVGYLKFGNLYASPNSLKGYKPYELMLTSLVTCSGALLVKLLQKKRIAFTDVSFIAEGNRDPDIANRIESIKITAYITFENVIAKEQLEKIEQLVIKNCGMLQTIIDSVNVTYSIQTKPAYGEGDAYD
ncbi:OsmC family protein [Metasolibacillus sp. FSL H7-0170]|uniref:OsmC family protein n=1 Tax=Metasolibacillus sp. FSL H7-0170 TaxID=2921431 RepID=UPI0031589D41